MLLSSYSPQKEKVKNNNKRVKHQKLVFLQCLTGLETSVLSVKIMMKGKTSKKFTIIIKETDWLVEHELLTGLTGPAGSPAGEHLCRSLLSFVPLICVFLLCVRACLSARIKSLTTSLAGTAAAKEMSSRTFQKSQVDPPAEPFL